jgi:ubiquinone/menaquinone biosynthesis C-methylase UbiE
MPPAADPTELTRRRWDEMAAGYDRSIAFFERILFSEGRRWVCSRASGDTLEIAVGTGRNLSLYPAGVHLVGVDLSPEMLRRARERAAESGLTVDLREGDAERLAFEDGSFDSIVI